MDWRDVAKVIAPLAPMAGSILGGLIPFPGGSLIGEQFGKVIARQFGVPETPQAVSEAVANSTEETARVKINAAVEQARVEVTGFVEIEKAYLHTVEVSLAQTGETMRAEIGHESLYFNGWRPATGWVFVFYSVVFGAMLSIAAAKAAFFAEPAPLKILTDAWPIFLAFFGALAAMVGVYIMARTTTQNRAIETGGPIPASITAKPPVPTPQKPLARAPAQALDRHAPA